MLENLIYEKKTGIAYVTVNRPAVRNALNAQTVRELKSAFEQVQNDGEVRVVILTGAGDKAFVAGADINELATQTPIVGKEFALAGQAVFDSIEQLGKPVIAAVNGYALGGGCELAMACTFRIASENAVLGQPEVKLGIIPGYGGSQRLPRLVGKGRALQIMLTGDMVPAAEAMRIGLVNQVVPQAELMSTVESIARKIMANAPLALKLCIEAVNRGMEMTMGDGQFLEAVLFGLCCATDDMKEGTRSFLEKRPPDFKGR
ncbi:MAG TPA: enoyl-CoA hydratase-related protein [Terriglobia bacterium]|nr:enoyl-CoA hydratase-related protein [Terriglobia bacterium]